MNKNKIKTLGNYPKEIQLILSCARRNIDTETVDRIKTLVKEKIDWQYLIQIAETHSIKPLLYKTINNTCPEAIPQTILTQLQKYFRTNAVRNIYLTRELLKLLDLFASENIPVICFKGPILTVLTYGDLSLRQFADLDILVAQQDVVKAKNLLLAQGSEMRFHVIELTDAEKEIFIKSETVHNFVRESAYEFDYNNGNFVIELHWDVIPKYFYFPLESEYLWQHQEFVSVLNKKVSSLSVEDSLLLLCGHGTKDCWDKLSRVCDIAELLWSYPNLNWERVILEASRRGGMRILLLGLLLAYNLLGAVLPELIWHKIKDDSEILALATQAEEWLFLPVEKRPQGVEKFFFHLKVKESLWDKFGYCFSLITTPTLSDWALLPESKIPSGYYYLIRPLRMFRKYGLKQFNIPTKV